MTSGANVDDDTVNCSYCLGAVSRSRGPRCWSCGAAHHRDCWYANGGCAQFACVAAPKDSAS